MLAFLERYEIPFSGTFRKVVNAGKNLRYARVEPRVRVVPFTVASERTAYWNAKVQEDIAVKAQIGRYRIRGYGATRPLPHLADIAFRHDLSTIEPDPDIVSKVELATSLGGRFGATPIELSMPVMIAPMSYGALSKSTKVALAKASALSDICDNSGEGGLIPEVREAAKRVVVQMLGGRLGWSVHAMRAADGVEIYISQGAKPGLGGQLMAKKVTEDIARLRGIPAGIDLRSPSRHPDVLGADDLVIKIEELREATGWEKPISVKLGAGRVRDDIKIAYKDGFDYVCLDGLQGSTGAAGNEVLEFVGIPTLPAIIEALDALDELEAIGHADHADGRRQGRHRHRQGDCARGARRRPRDERDHRRRVHRVPAVRGRARASSASRPRIRSSRRGTTSRSSRGTSTATSSRALAARERRTRPRLRLGLRPLPRDLVALTPEAAEITRLPYEPTSSGIHRSCTRMSESNGRSLPPEPDVYGAERAIFPAVPDELAGRDDVLDAHFVPAPCQVACPIGTDAPSYLAYIWEGKAVRPG